MNGTEGNSTNEFSEMNQSQKRCLAASGGTHLLLLSALMFGSAFFVPEPKKVLNTRLKVVPTMLVDEALSGGGGNPNLQPTEDREKGHIQAPEPPKPPKPKIVEPPKPPPPKPPPPKPRTEKPPVKKPPVKKPPRKEPKKVVLKPVTAKERNKILGKKPPQPDREAKRRADQMAKELESLRKGFKDGTQVEVHGTGGAAYANYAQTIFEIYDQAWMLVQEGDSGNATTKVRVVIERNGRVKSARIIRRSGNSVLDNSVQKALDRVRRVPPFPSGSRDREREFIINFNLESGSIST
jgi:TonB family protein